MSMLTPPGMGGKYRITGNAYPRMRRPHRRRRLVLVLFAAVVAVALTGWGTLQLIGVFSGGGKDKVASAGGRPACTPAPSAAPAKAVALPAPGAVKVNVLNATPRGGLAKETADELRKRGFKVGEVGNAPKAYDKKVKGVAILLGAPSAADGAFPLLGTQLGGETTEYDARAGKDVDLIIGNAFKKLSPQKEADAALAALRKPAPARNSC